MRSALIRSKCTRLKVIISNPILPMAGLSLDMLFQNSKAGGLAHFPRLTSRKRAVRRSTWEKTLWTGARVSEVGGIRSGPSSRFADPKQLLKDPDPHAKEAGVRFHRAGDVKPSCFERIPPTSQQSPVRHHGAGQHRFAGRGGRDGGKRAKAPRRSRWCWLRSPTCVAFVLPWSAWSCPPPFPLRAHRPAVWLARTEPSRARSWRRRPSCAGATRRRACRGTRGTRRTASQSLSPRVMQRKPFTDPARGVVGVVRTSIARHARSHSGSGRERESGIAGESPAAWRPCQMQLT